MLNQKFAQLLTAALIFISTAFAQQPIGNLQYVDPTIGSVGLILEPTRPAIHLPNSMVRVFPARVDQLDDQISHFPLTISSHRQNWLFGLMPFSGTVNEQVWNKKFTSDNEKISPDFYSVLLEDQGTQISFSPTARTGFFKFVFSNKDHNYLRLNILNGGTVNLEGKNTITGVEEFQGMKAYFYAETSVPIADVNYQDAQTKKKALFKIANQAQNVAFRYGISFISIAQAKENLYKEIKDWDILKVRDNAKSAWNKVLSQINIKGGTLAQKRVFYTSLYRSKNVVKEVNFSIDTDYKGVAATGGGKIVYNPDWFRKHQGDIDVVTHEVMHVVQNYGRGGGPGWLTEGIADYVRFKYGVVNLGANWTLPAFKPEHNYKNAYRITARFLNHLEQALPGIVVKLDHAMRTHTYKEAIWSEITGKTIDELWSVYAANPGS